MNFYILNVDKDTKNYVEQIKDLYGRGKIKPADIHVYGGGFKSSDRVYVHDENGISFLARYLAQSSELDLAKEDQLIPSHTAPHILAQVVIALLESEGCHTKFSPMPGKLGTVLEKDIQEGITIYSMTEKECPPGCVEISLCYKATEKVEGDLGDLIGAYADRNKLNFIGFRASRFSENIFTIPMKDIIAGWLKIEKLLEEKKGHKFLVATYSRCHGIAALFTATKK